MDNASRELIRDALENFQHVPYMFAQNALGVDDGGFASIYDSDTSGEFDGRFSSQIGAGLLHQVMSDIGNEAFSINSRNLFNNDMMPEFGNRLPDTPSSDDLTAMGAAVADAALAHVLQVFPEANEAGLAHFRQPMADFMTNYMQAELNFAADWAARPPIR